MVEKAEVEKAILSVNDLAVVWTATDEANAGWVAVEGLPASPVPAGFEAAGLACSDEEALLRFPDTRWLDAYIDALVDLRCRMHSPPVALPLTGDRQGKGQ